jgi:cobalt/nickel transport system permease protein
MSEHYARQDGLLQKLDPRVKLMAALLLLLITGLSRSLWLLAGLWLISLLLIILSNLPVLTLEKRIWGIIPLITLLAAIPGMFNIVNPGTPLLMIHVSAQAPTWLGMELPDSIFLSRQGVLAAAFLFLRVGLSLSFGILLAVTTPAADLFRSLRFIRVPAIFVMVIEMTYRYLSLLLNISIEMYEARSMRTVGMLPLKRQRAQFGSSLAVLFARSMALSEEIYQAMAARGYTGKIDSAAVHLYDKLDLCEKL